MIGIVNIKIIASIIAGLANSAGKILEDNTIDEKDLAQLIPLIPVLQKLTEIEYSQLPSELSDLDASEREQLVDAFNSEFDIPQDDVEIKIEKGLAFINEGYSYILRLIEYIKSFKVL